MQEHVSYKHKSKYWKRKRRITTIGLQISSLAFCTINPDCLYNSPQCHKFKCLSSTTDLAQKQQFKSTLCKGSPHTIGNIIQEERPCQVPQLTAFCLKDTNFHQIASPLVVFFFFFFPSLSNLDYFSSCLSCRI